MNKKKNRIGRELILIFLLFFSLTVVLLLVGSFITHYREVDNIQRDRVSQLSATTASILDGEYLEMLKDAVTSEEYQDLLERALPEEDETLLTDYLEKKGLYADYVRYMNLLNSMQAGAQVEALWVLDLSNGDAVHLLSSGESILSLGLRENVSEKFASLTGNTPVPATVFKSDEGWLCTSAEPVISPDGSSPAVAGVLLNMTDVMNRRFRFIALMIFESVVILILIAFTGSFYIRKLIADPISDLASQASAFGANGNDTLEDQVVAITRHKDDEITDLYEDIRRMQLGIISYLNHLTSITEEKERLLTELNIANRIQASMLPSTFPAFPDRNEFDVYALMKPAKSVAGDFYDFFLIDEDHLGVVMADVSGKGIPASLFMMMAKIIISSIAQMGIPPHEVLERSNERICMNNDADMFVTVWFGIITISTGHVVASNAGHEFPALQNKDGVFELFHDRHGFVLGGMNGVHYKDYEFDLVKGQTLFLYTDGVPEATTEWNEQFGTDRMVDALNLKKDADPQELVHYMLRTVDDFDGDVPQFDDITMLAIRYKGPAEKNLEQDEEIEKNSV